jgi:serine/threonine protein kinase
MKSAQRYRLVRTLGTGGMAQVFSAVAEGHGVERRVAIKRMLGAIADDAARAMFLDEARIASQLHHGSIVQVLDYGVVEQDPFMVLELVDGLDVGRAARVGRSNGVPISEGVALHVCAELAHALAYVHARSDDAGRSLGIVHRDVSPGNVLCSWEGDVKLSDFGIALALSRAEKTAAGVVKGKPGYMAPEQGLGREVTGAADVFALGNTLHALLTGAPVRSGEELPWWLTEGRPPPVSGKLPDDLRALVTEMVAISPAARPTAAQVATRCEALLRSRLEAGPRSALRAWLAQIRERLEPDAALDQLFDVAIVPASTEETTRSGAARFDVVRLAAPTREAPREHATDPTVAAKPVEVIAAARAPTSGSRSRMWASAGLVAIALVAVGITVSFQSRAPSVTAPPRQAPEGASLTPVEPPPAPPAEPPAVPTPSTVAAEPPPIDVSPSDVTAPASSAPSPSSRASVPPRTVASPRRASAPEETSPATEPAAPVFGWLRVGSAELAGAALEIDGVRAGYLPALRRVPAGPHRVVVRSVEGEAIALEREVLIAPEHTQSSPLVVR